jgi:hypothetical protein
MRRKGILGVSAYGAMALGACVGDSTTPTGDGGSDATLEASTQDAPTETSTQDSGGGDAADATVPPCSDPTMGTTFALPTSTFNSFTQQQSAPLLAGDYVLTYVPVFSALATSVAPAFPAASSVACV